MSTNLLFKETDQAESIYKTVGMERKKKQKTCSLLILFMLYPDLSLRLWQTNPSCRAFWPLLWKRNVTNALCFAFSSALSTRAPAYMRFWSFPARIVRKESWKRKVKAEEDQKLGSRQIWFSLCFSFWWGGEGKEKCGGELAHSAAGLSRTKVSRKRPEKHLWGQENRKWRGSRASFTSRVYPVAIPMRPLSLLHKRNCTLEGEKPLNYKAR